VAPAMNEKMWTNKQNQQNIANLRVNGVKILEPKSDILACGEYGIGKMIEPQEIFTTVENFFNNQNILADKNIIVTAGATYEPIDPVRFIGNYSSGKQGILIAEKLTDLGADVTLIAANISQNINLNAKNIIRVKSATEMMEAVNNKIKETDVFIGCAAVADFKPKNYSNQKIKKGEGKLDKIELVENIDILKTIGNSKNRPQIVIGFAAESDNLIKNATKKLKEKNCDFIVANNINNGAVFGSNENQISILDKNGKVENFTKMSKAEVADIVVKKLVELIKN